MGKLAPLTRPEQLKEVSKLLKVTKMWALAEREKWRVARKLLQVERERGQARLEAEQRRDEFAAVVRRLTQALKINSLRSLLGV